MQKIVLATDNQGKVAEFNSLLQAHFIVEPQSNYQVVGVAETGLSFIENAILKARNAAKHTKMWALADDSGLSVEGLNGEPGIYSARYSNGDSEQNIDKLLENLADVENREAYFYSAIALLKYANDPTPIIAVGEWRGEILRARRGNNGFGYDSVFYIPELKKTSAELDSAQKNTISHRALALNNLLKQL